MNSIAYQAPKSQFPDLDSIHTGACPKCGYSLEVVREHIGGIGQAPFVVCSNRDSGYVHVHEPISDRLAWEYNDFVLHEEVAFGLHEENTFEEQGP